MGSRRRRYCAFARHGAEAIRGGYVLLGGEDGRAHQGRFCEVRFKPLSGKEDQAGGIVFRFKKRQNYYIVRANALEDNVVLYKTVNGKRSSLQVKGRMFGTVWTRKLPKAKIIKERHAVGFVQTRTAPGVLKVKSDQDVRALDCGIVFPLATFVSTPYPNIRPFTCQRGPLAIDRLVEDHVVFERVGRTM